MTGKFSLRNLVGPEVLLDEDEERQKGGPRTKKQGKIIVLYQRPVTENTKPLSRDVTDLIDPATTSRSDVSASLVDTTVYQGEHHVVWISSWPTKAAAIELEKSVSRTEGDNSHLVRIVRDYGKNDRKEAPEGADAAQAASVSEGDETANSTTL
ncbi:MAG: hypothetical protein M1837_007330 [Sclerophora amabilis]|nr:MAG: hypothetical protein M1837_007330 [Sclerophora amabilis]